ncbi:hypothetical protein L0666_09835 [Octadecabacter sp. CECT 8868]|uniref:hypothetical protein n=1 Tax=Octadecabacter algicola TaxID=2909342 RepID=UPI001F3090B4|nr:hypothetical protein [Octadecabacter algicola]MCF2905290.1 hypothetical protein [Octadecabacter algicola]
MTDVDISDFESPERWLRSQTDETRFALASRGALRVVANFRPGLDGPLNDLDLGLFRAILTSAVYSQRHSSDVNWRSILRSAHSAADSAATVAEDAFGDSHPAALYARDSVGSISNIFSGYGVDPSSGIAAQWDASHLDGLFRHPVWKGSKVPQMIAENHTTLLAKLKAGAEWVFWQRFYEGMWNGTFDEWDLALEVIQIDNEIWKEGVEAVADEIAKIEARLKPDPLPDAEAVRLAQKIVAKPETAILAADGLAQLIEMATQEYKREVSNALPEELEPLDSLPAILNDLSLILTSSKPNTDKEAQLQAALKLTASTVFDLNRRLKAAATELESLRRNGKGRRLFADAFYEKAGERTAELITSKVLWGGLMTGAGFLLGGGSAEALTNGVQECFQGIIQPEANEAVKPSIKPK